MGIQQAETRADSTLSPMLVPDEDGGGDGGSSTLDDITGGGGDGGDEGDLLGISLDELLGGGDDEGDGGGSGGIEGFGGPDDDDIEIPAVNARALSSISITGVLPDDEGGDGGSGGGGDLGNIFEDLDLGGILGGDDESEDGSGGSGPLEDVTGQSADGAGTVQAQQGEGDDGGSILDLEDILGDLGGSSGDQLTQIVFDALLRLGVIESEAVAVCTNNEVRFDVASRLVDDQGSDIEIGDVLDDVISEVVGGSGTEDEALLESLLGDLIDTEEGEVGFTPDGGVFINALRITVGEDLDLGGILDGGEEGDGGGSSIIDDITGGGDGGGGGEGDEPLLDIVLGHSEVSSTVCAQQAPAPAAQPLPPAGDQRTLPVTGGGLGVLPGILGLGLAGGALAAGRLALRSRREHTL